MDIMADYFQARGFDRDVHVKPWQKQDGSPGLLWMLEVAAYSLAESSRLWYLKNSQRAQECVQTISVEIWTHSQLLEGPNHP